MARILSFDEQQLAQQLGFLVTNESKLAAASTGTARTEHEGLSKYYSLQIARLQGLTPKFADNYLDAVQLGVYGTKLREYLQPEINAAIARGAAVRSLTDVKRIDDDNAATAKLFASLGPYKAGQAKSLRDKVIVALSSGDQQLADAYDAEYNTLIGKAQVPRVTTAQYLQNVIISGSPSAKAEWKIAAPDRYAGQQKALYTYVYNRYNSIPPKTNEDVLRLNRIARGEDPNTPISLADQQLLDYENSLLPQVQQDIITNRKRSQPLSLTATQWVFVGLGTVIALAVIKKA